MELEDEDESEVVKRVNRKSSSDYVANLLAANVVELKGKGDLM